MPYSYFTSEQLTPIVISAFILLASVLAHRRNMNMALALLCLGSFGLAYFIAALDPFLILWDEQYHALVAKNLSQDPLKPMLYKEQLLDFNYKVWTDNEVWLHKQPLFLWQMAMSIKLLGTTELAVRLPSMIMHGLLPFFVYRMGSIITTKQTGYIAAILMAVAYFPLELAAGRYSTDHNDLAFLFYVTASFWAWFEYTRSQKKRWLFLIGVLSGAAVLVKWLMGLLVFVIWGLTATFTKTTWKERLTSYLPIVYSGIISLAVFLPWQLFIHFAYPKEAAYETGLNGRHFFEAIEDHGEPLMFHFTHAFRKIYGSGALIPVLMLLGIVLLLAHIKNHKHRLFIASAFRSFMCFIH